MDCKIMQENGARARSFRHEDYKNRRVFLRSYPLHWGEDRSTDKERGRGRERTITKNTEKKPPSKMIILSVMDWSEGKVLVLRRFKDKFTVYIMACVPARLKHPTALISA